jgi:hypothetical protein
MRDNIMAALKEQAVASGSSVVKSPEAVLKPLARGAVGAIKVAIPLAAAGLALFVLLRPLAPKQNQRRQ